MVLTSTCAIIIIDMALFQICYPRLMVMLKKYDGLNAAIQENLIAIRVVKAFGAAAAPQVSEISAMRIISPPSLMT